MTIYLYFQSDNSSQNSNSRDFSRMYVLLEFHEIFFDYLLWCYVILTNEQPIRKPRVGFPHVRRDGTFSMDRGHGVNTAVSNIPDDEGELCLHVFLY